MLLTPPLPVGLGGEEEAPPRRTPGTSTTLQEIILPVGPICWPPTPTRIIIIPSIARALATQRHLDAVDARIIIHIYTSHESPRSVTAPHLTRTKRSARSTLNPVSSIEAPAPASPSTRFHYTQSQRPTQVDTVVHPFSGQVGTPRRVQLRRRNLVEAPIPSYPATSLRTRISLRWQQESLDAHGQRRRIFT